MNIVILTSPNQWFVEYAQKLRQIVKDSSLYYNHEDLKHSYDILFILSYHKIVQEQYLKLNKHNIVIHSSPLPKGKGWAPMFWQVLEGKNEIVFTMFEAIEKLDSGNIYMKKLLTLNGYELNKELREKQANLILDMCLEFVNNYEKYKVPHKQIGNESFYRKRTPKDSELDINKTINEQFNLLRIVDNENYPAFFYKDGKKYLIKIEQG